MSNNKSNNKSEREDSCPRCRHTEYDNVEVHHYHLDTYFKDESTEYINECRRCGTIWSITYKLTLLRTEVLEEGGLK